MKVINISVDEFIKEINRYLEGPDELILERDGQIIGHYRPRREQKEAEIKLSFERLNQAIDRAAAESGTDRETVIDALDPSQPFPLVDLDEFFDNLENKPPDPQELNLEEISDIVKEVRKNNR